MERAVPDAETASIESYELPSARDENGGTDKPKTALTMQATKSGKNIDISAMMADIPQDLIEMLDEDGDGNISWAELKSAITKRVDAETRVGQMRRAIIALVIAVFVVVGANSAATVVSLEMSKESHVRGQQMVTPDGQKVRVANSEMGVQGDGELCSRDESGECQPGALKTGEARRPVALMELPLVDSKELAKLRELVVALPQEGGSSRTLALQITGSMKHGDGETATLYGGPCGSYVFVNSTSGTASVMLDGQEYSVSDPEWQGSRRLWSNGYGSYGYGSYGYGRPYGYGGYAYLSWR